MFAHLEALLLEQATLMPLPLFAAASSFIEEIIAPIPSGPVMLVMGSLAQLQGYTLLGLLGLTLMAVTGKLLGSLVVYAIADKAEDVVLGRCAKFLGVTHAQIEGIGKRLGNGWKDYVLLTLLRALPFVPSALISFGAGVLKIRLRLFIVATVIGSIIRDALFLYFGYLGFKGAEELLARFSTIETFVQVGVVLGVILVFGVYLYLRTKRKKQ